MNSNFVLKEDGWHKKDNSQTRGNASYFQREPPPVRDAATGHPIGKGGGIDWKRVIEEVNNKEKGT